MGYDVSACAVFGILIDEEVAERLGQPWEDFLAATAQSHDFHDSDDFIYPDEAAEPFTAGIIKALDSMGIVVPEESHLFHTGTQDERPGRTETDANQWIIGIGLLDKPWQFPRCYASFQDLARWHTWVVGG